MSHDQRPGRMRVVAQSRVAAAPGRTVSAKGKSGTAVSTAAAAHSIAAGGAAAASAPMSMTAKLLLAAIFLIGCAGGGVVIAMLAGLSG